MSYEEALMQIDQMLNEHSRSTPVKHEEVACQDTKAAAQALSAVLAELRGSDGLYRQRGRRGFLAPPPGRAPPA